MKSVNYDQVKKAQELDYSRKIRFTLKCDDASNLLFNTVRFLIAGSHVNLIPKQDRSAQNIDNTMCAIILDLYTAWKADPSLYLRVSLNANYYKKCRYLPYFIGYASVKKVITALEQSKLIEFHKGFFDTKAQEGKEARLRASNELISHFERVNINVASISDLEDSEVIFLKDSKKDLIEYKDNNEIRSMRSNIRTVNKLLSNTLIDVYLSDEVQVELQWRMSDRGLDEQGEERALDFTKKNLVRIFNNESFRDGGRFYGGWWQGIPKAYRKYIMIDGLKTYEIDYSTLHPRLLYLKAGLEIPEEDFYSIEGVDGEYRPILLLPSLLLKH